MRIFRQKRIHRAERENPSGQERIPGNPHYTEITLIFLADYKLNRQLFFGLFSALEFAQYTPRGDVCFDSVRLFNDFSNGITCDNDDDDDDGDDGNVRFRFVCCPMPIHTLSGIDRNTRDATMKTKIGGEATIRLRR